VSGAAAIAPAIAGHGRPLLQNRVLASLLIVAVIAIAATGFVAQAPNRLLSGHAVALWQAASPGMLTAMTVLAVGMLAACLAAPSRALHLAVAGAGAALLLATLAAAGGAAWRLSVGASPAARTSLGAGFWVLLFCAALMIVDALQRLRAGPGLRLVVAVAVVLAVAAIAATGRFDQLSIIREYANRRDVFVAALLRHVWLVVGSVLPALLIGMPLGIIALRRPALRTPLFSTLNLLQTVPSIALFGLLIAPLSALSAAVPSLRAIGVQGIGVAPALIALVLYALLPVVRNTYAGFAGVDGGVLESARGMGLAKRQIFWQVELPLSAPVLLAGLRIVTVQAIGLAVVAALIGAGGLGTFVWQGLGQDAVDLVLLGAVPAILLALAADFLLQILTAFIRRKVSP